jgi:biopolymer transport protein ExbD
VKFFEKTNIRETRIIEIAPLVDIVFQLLLFFLLTATFVKSPTLEINLPRASLEATTPRQREVIIVIDKRGQLKYQKKEISQDKLKAILKRKFSSHPETMILLQADKNTRHGKVVEIMDLAKEIGFSRLGIAIEPKEK